MDPDQEEQDFDRQECESCDKGDLVTYAQNPFRNEVVDDDYRLVKKKVGQEESMRSIFQKDESGDGQERHEEGYNQRQDDSERLDPTFMNDIIAVEDEE